MDGNDRTRSDDDCDGLDDLALEQAIETMSVDEIARLNHTVDQLRHRVDALEEALDIHRRRERERLVDVLAVHLDRPVNELMALDLQDLRDIADEVAVDVMASDSNRESVDGNSGDGVGQQRGFR